MYRATMKPKPAVSFLILALVFATLVPSPAAAGVERFEFDLPISDQVVPCLGEEVDGLIHVRALVHARPGANGGFHYTEHWTITGWLVGQTSGTEWFFRGASNQRGNTQGEQVTGGLTETTMAIAGGDAPNLAAVWRRQLVINANGVLVRDVEVRRFECRGPQ